MKDNTAAERQKRRDEKIKASGLVQRKVVAHPDFFPKLRKIAKDDWERRGVTLE